MSSDGSNGSSFRTSFDRGGKVNFSVNMSAEDTASMEREPLVQGESRREITEGSVEPLISGHHDHLPPLRRLAFGVGHVFNDMCASMWFTYLILFYHRVVNLNNAFAGLLLLIGQVTDAAATPLIGYLCDRIHFRYGRRKTWHLIGTIMVASSLFFFWHCLPCETHHDLAYGWKFFYFVPFIMIFQIGWASTQISHLALIPELTADENERVGLNSIRYAFTILANLSVFATVWVLLKVVNPHSKEIGPGDEWIFSGTALGVTAVGLLFALIFHLGTKEPRAPVEQKGEDAAKRKITWYRWFLKPQLYMVAVIYMCTRMIVNLTQLYTPLYLVDTLHMDKSSVAIGPLVIFLTGFVVTLLLKLLNKHIGRYMAYFIGLILLWGSLLWFYNQPSPDTLYHTKAENAIYGATLLLGAGATTLLVTSLSMVADLIGCTVESGAFVYGLMSFTDKLSNGIAVQIIQALHPCKDTACCPACASYYRLVLVSVPGGASLVALVALVFLTVIIYRRNRQCRDVAPPVCVKNQPGTGNCDKQGSVQFSTSKSCSIEQSLESTSNIKNEKKPLLGAPS